MEKIRTAIIGAGKMGRIHAKVYGSLAQCDLVAVVDADLTKAEHLASNHDCDGLADCEKLLGKVDAVTIATPTVSHFELAELFIKNKVAVMIEKPLAATVEQGRRIVELAREYGTVVAVGHSERCNPVVQAMRRLDIEPKFIEASRISPYPFRSTDVGVVLDVMIHDIDIILSMAQSAITKIDAVGVSVIDEKEDICNARIVFDNGCMANITASRLALKTERKVRVFSRQAYLSLDYLKKTGMVIKAAPNANLVAWIKEQRKNEHFNPLSVNWPDLLHIEELSIDDKEPLRLEQEAFLQCCLGERPRPEVSAEEGLAAMECADAILASVKEHKWS